MASKSTISIDFKVSDSENGFKKLTLTGEALQKIMRSNVVEAKKLQTTFINFASVATSVDQINSAFSTIATSVKELTSAYAVQEEAETKLAQTMKNSMSATVQDVQAIKDLCSAQQQLGVIGDEVQLAGAQEIATYLELKNSLKSMIPVMNDMLAQQYGMNATSENAAQIATMLGKVLQGQTGALSRYGYKFDEAEEKILKYGSEAERVGVLVEVITRSVGGMNQKLAQTDSGKIKQLENNLGDLKEQLGKIATNIQPILTIGANATVAVGGVLKLVQAVRALNLSLKSVQATMGIVGLAIAAVGYAIYHFTGNTRAATDAMNELATATGRAAREARELKAIQESGNEAKDNAKDKLERDIKRLQEFKGNTREEKKLVQEMNDTYGASMQFFSSRQAWLNALTKNADNYIGKIEKIAQLEQLRNLKNQALRNKKALFTDENGNDRQLDTTKKRQYLNTSEGATGYTYIGGPSGPVKRYYKELDSEQDEAMKNAARLDKMIEGYEKQMDKLSIEVDNIHMPVIGQENMPDLNKTVKVYKTRVQQIDEELKKLRDSYSQSSEEDKKSIKVKIDALEEEKRAIDAIMDELDRPAEFRSLEDYDKEIAYQNKLRKTTTQENLKGIDEIIERLNKERAAFEKSSRVYLDPSKIKTYSELARQISYYMELLQEGTEEERKFAENNLPALQKKQREWEKYISKIGQIDPTIHYEDPDFETRSIEDKRQSLQNAKSRAEQIKNDLANKIIDRDQAQKEIEEINRMLVEKLNLEPLKLTITTDGKLQTLQEILDKAREKMDLTTGSIGKMGSAMSQLGGFIGGTEGDLVSFAGTTIQTIAEVIPEILKMIGVYEAEALAGATASGAGIGFPQNLAAIAAGVAAVTSIIASIPKFANGGIVSGPTIGLMGEYPGASSNPEVIAPLDKLQSMLGETGPGTVRVVGESRISGREIVMVLRNETKVSSKSGRKTGIII